MNVLQYSRHLIMAIILGSAAIATADNRSTVEQRVNRDVEVVIKRVPPMVGLLSKGKVTVQNDFDVDSYDSSDPAYSNNGVYSSAKAKANGFVGTISTIAGDMLVKDNAQIRGDVGQGAPAVISVSSPASVGDAAYVSSSTGLQGGHLRNGVNNTIPNLALPFAVGGMPMSGMVGATLYDWVLTNGNYRIMGTLTIDGTKKMIVTGKARLYVSSTIYVKDSGLIQIQPGASLELYIGQQIYVSGNGRINPTGTPDQFLLVGLTTVAEVYFQDNAFVNGVVHTPQAKIDMSGNAQFCGAGNANNIVLQGMADFHFDEALNTNREGVFQITNWKER